jgi:hypothetical protein
MSSIWTDLMFLHGHIAGADLARSLVREPAPRTEPELRAERSADPSPKRDSGTRRCQPGAA